MRICLYGASSPEIAPEYIRLTEQLGEAMAAAGTAWSTVRAAPA